MIHLPFLYSAVVEDDRSPSGRRRLVCIDHVESEIRAIDGFDRTITVRSRMARVREPVSIETFGVLGRRIACQISVDLVGETTAFYAARTFPVFPDVVAGMSSILGNLAIEKTRHDRNPSPVPLMTDLSGLDVLSSDHDRRRASALRAVSRMIHLDGVLYSTGIEPVFVAKRKMNQRSYADLYGRLVRRDVVEGWRHHAGGTYDSGSMSFAPYLNLRAAVEADFGLIFDELTIDGDLGSIDFRFPEVSANIYEISKYILAETDPSILAVRPLASDTQFVERMRKLRGLVEAYERVDEDVPDPLLAGTLVNETIEWASGAFDPYAEAMLTEKMIGLCGRFTNYWAGRGATMALTERHALRLDETGVASVEDEDALASLDMGFSR